MLRQLLLAGLALFLVVSAAATQETPVSLTGVIDFHTHAGPDSRPRSMDDIEAARQMVAFDGGRGKVVWLPTFDAEFNEYRIGPAQPRAVAGA